MFVEFKAAPGIVIQADTSRVFKEDFKQSFWLNLDHVLELTFRKAQPKGSEKEIGLITIYFNNTNRKPTSLFYKPDTLPIFQELMDHISENYLLG